MSLNERDLGEIERRQQEASSLCERQAGDPGCHLIHTDVPKLIKRIRELERLTDDLQAYEQAATSLFNVLRGKDNRVR